MRQQTTRAGRYVLGALTAAALAFGASQAVAGPPQARDSARLCDPLQCDNYCVSRGASHGKCGLAGGCRCYYL